MLNFIRPMFAKIDHTNFPPKRHTLVWDGTCGFCKFWKTRWELKTGNTIDYVPYQNVADDFPDIPIKEFKKASRLIESDGRIYSGPDSAYRSLFHSGKQHWHSWYRHNRLFRKLSDIGYNHIAKHRSFYYKLTIFCLGKNSKNLTHYWILYLIIFLGIGIASAYIF